MDYLAADRLPPFFHIYNVRTQTVLASAGGAMGPQKIGFIPWAELGKSWTQIDAATWYAEDAGSVPTYPRLRLRNRKSGLYLLVTPDRHLLQDRSADDLRPPASGAAWRPNDPRAYAGEDWLVQGATLEKTRLVCLRWIWAEVPDGSPPGTSRGTHAEALYLGDRQVSVAQAGMFDAAFWRESDEAGQPDDWQIRTVGTFRPADAAALADQAKIAGGVAVAGKVASDLFKTLADILKSTNQTNVALALLGLSFAARLAAGIAEMLSFFGGGKKDDLIQTFYRTMLPAIRDVVKAELHASQVNEALGAAQTGRNALGVAAGLVAQANLPATGGTASAEAFRAALGPDVVAAIDRNLLQAGENLEEARGKLEVYPDSFPPWIVVASLILAVDALRYLVFPEKYGAEVRVRLSQVRAYGAGVIDPARAARRARIVGAADTNTWYPNTIELPMDAFLAHVDTCTDLAYGAPSGLIGSIDAFLAGMTAPAPAPT